MFIFAAITIAMIEKKDFIVYAFILLYFIQHHPIILEATILYRLLESFEHHQWPIFGENFPIIK